MRDDPFAFDPRPKRYDPLDEDFDRHRRDRDWDEPADDYEDRGGSTPEERVRGPGLALFVIGVIGFCITVAVLVVAAWFFLTERDGGAGFIATGVYFLVFGAFALVYFGAIMAGGSRMRRCRSYGLAMTAAILALLSIIVLGLCGIAVLPFGIWALVVLLQRDVREAFRGPRERPRAADAYD